VKQDTAQQRLMKNDDSMKNDSHDERFHEEDDKSSKQAKGRAAKADQC